MLQTPTSASPLVIPDDGPIIAPELIEPAGISPVIPPEPGLKLLAYVTPPNDIDLATPGEELPTDQITPEPVKRISLKAPWSLYQEMLVDVATNATIATNIHAYILETLTLARTYRQAVQQRDGLLDRIEALQQQLTLETAQKEQVESALASALERIDEMADQPVVPADADVETWRQQLADLSRQLAEETSRADDALEVLALQRTENERLKNQQILPADLASQQERSAAQPDAAQRDAAWFEIVTAVCEAAAAADIQPAKVKARLLKVAEEWYNKKLNV